jgi:hypothetical protein
VEHVFPEFDAPFRINQRDIEPDQGQLPIRQGAHEFGRSAHYSAHLTVRQTLCCELMGVGHFDFDEDSLFAVLRNDVYLARATAPPPCDDLMPRLLIPAGNGLFGCEAGVV